MKTAETQLSRRIERFINEYHLIAPGDRVLVGVSGGPDSVCLLQVLQSLCPVLGFDVVVAHLNHQLRGMESDADAAYVKELARESAIPCIIDSRDVKAYKSVQGNSLEEAAREVRYSFFAQAAEQAGAQAVALGHTIDDQAETIIMHMIRGTGLSGLQGMQPRSEMNTNHGWCLKIIRPLLETSRQETREYCSQAGLNPCLDSSNQSPEHLRNRIRDEIMPRLSEYNPSFVRSLARMACLISDDIDFFEGETDRGYNRIVAEIPDGVALDNHSFAGLHPAMKRRLLRRVFARLLGTLRDIEMVHIDDIIETTTKPAGKTLSLPGGLTLYGDYDKSYITRGENPLSLLPPLVETVSLQIPGETRVSGWTVNAEVWPGRPEMVEAGDLVAFFDLDLTGGELIVRTRREGDRFQPLGMRNSRKLQDVMTDDKVSRAWRDSIPLVCSGDRVIWVVGWRTDHLTRVTDLTQRTLRLEFHLGNRV